MFLSLSRIIKYGSLNFWRNKAISMASISVLTLTLIIITGVALLSIIAQTVLTSIEGKIDIAATFKTDAAEEQVVKIKTALEGLEEVGGVEYITREQALTQFRERHKNDEVVLRSLDEVGENPFGATLNIKAKKAADPVEFERIARFLQQDVYAGVIDKVNYFDNKVIIEKLSAITGAARRGGVALSLVLILIAVLVAFNTIRLTIYTTRDRFTIMRLVGSSNWFIRGPVIVENALNGALAAVITMVLYMAGLSITSTKITEFFAGPNIDINLWQSYLTNFWQFFLLQLGVAVILGIIASLFALRRYLKV